MFISVQTAASLLAAGMLYYIDVSATTYIIQIVASIAVAAGVTAGVVISKIKKKAKEKLNIDLDKKEQEEDVVIYDDNNE